MIVVFKTGGKQYKASENKVLKVEKISGEPGSTIEFTDVMLVADSEGKILKLGNPIVNNVIVTAEIVAQKKEDKIIVFKKQRRQHYRRKNGHRQQMTHVRITNIKVA